MKGITLLALFVLILLLSGSGQSAENEWDIRRQEQLGIRDGYHAAEAAKEQLKHVYESTAQGGKKIAKKARKLGRHIKEEVADLVNNLETHEGKDNKRRPLTEERTPGTINIDEEYETYAEKNMPEIIQSFKVKTDHGSIMDGVKRRATEAPDSVKDTVQDAYSEARSVGEKIGDIVKEKGAKVAENINIAKDTIADKFQKAKNVAEDRWEKAKDVTEDKWEDVKDVAEDKWEKAKDVAKDNWEKTKDVAEDKWEKTKDVGSDKWEEAKDTASDNWEKAKDTASDNWEKAKDVSSDKWEETKEKLEDAKDAVSNESKSIFQRTKGFFYSIHLKAMDVKGCLDRNLRRFIPFL